MTLYMPDIIMKQCFSLADVWFCGAEGSCFEGKAVHFEVCKSVYKCVKM